MRRSGTGRWRDPKGWPGTGGEAAACSLLGPEPEGSCRGRVGTETTIAAGGPGESEAGPGRPGFAPGLRCPGCTLHFLGLTRVWSLDLTAAQRLSQLGVEALLARSLPGSLDPYLAHTPEGEHRSPLPGYCSRDAGCGWLAGAARAAGPRAGGSLPPAQGRPRGLCLGHGHPAPPLEREVPSAAEFLSSPFSTWGGRAARGECARGHVCVAGRAARAAVLRRRECAARGDGQRHLSSFELAPPGHSPKEVTVRPSEGPV